MKLYSATGKLYNRKLYSTVILQNAVLGGSELIYSETPSLMQERSIIPFYSE